MQSYSTVDFQLLKSAFGLFSVRIVIVFLTLVLSDVLSGVFNVLKCQGYVYNICICNKI